MSIKKATIELYYYPDWLESLLSDDLEQKGMEAMKLLIKRKNFYKLTDDEQRQVFRWIFIQILRTKKFEAHMSSALKDAIIAGRQTNPVFFPDPFWEKLTKNDFNFKAIPEIYDALKISLWDFMSEGLNINYQILKTHNWMIIENKSLQSYYTSDNPVVVIRHNGTQATQFNFTTTSDMEKTFLPTRFSFEIKPDASLLIPLTPKLCLLINNLKGQPVEFALEKEVSKTNETILVWAERYIFSNENDFDAAVECIKTCEIESKPLKSMPKEGRIISMEAKVDLPSISAPTNINELLASLVQKRILSQDIMKKLSDNPDIILMLKKIISDSSFNSILKSKLTPKELKILKESGNKISPDNNISSESIIKLIGNIGWKELTKLIAVFKEYMTKNQLIDCPACGYIMKSSEIQCPHCGKELPIHN